MASPNNGRGCILHIGPHKTGSSSIQQTLFHELSDKGFEYARLGTANHSILLYSMFSGSPEDYLHHRARGLNALDVDRFNTQGWRKLTRAVRKAKAPTVIFSGEGVCRLKPDELARLKDFLFENFETVTVAGYMRPPRSLMQSVFQQRIKMKLVGLDLSRYYPQYREKLEKFDLIFGAGQTRFWKFAPSEFPGGDVVRHFFAALGIEAPETVRRTNESVSRQAIQILYAYHKYGRDLGVGPGVPAVKNAVVRAVSGLTGDKFRFSSELVNPLLAANRDDIAWAENRIGASLAEPEGDDTGAIRSENDLLDIGEAAIAFLVSLVQERGAPPAPDAERARYAAKLVDTLAGSLTVERKQDRHNRPGRKDKGRKNERSKE